MREGGNERRKRERGEREKTAALPSVLNQLQISREPPLQRALCNGVCRRRRRGSHHGGRGSGQGDVESENETRGGRGGGGGRGGRRGGGSGVERKRE